jgi:hypothetical protein
MTSGQADGGNPVMRILSIVFLAVLTSVGAAFAADAPRFERDVLPILKASCFKCHGATPQANLDLRSVASTLKGGASGSVIVKGNAEKSLLFQRIAHRTMPPATEKPLTDAQIEMIRKWIDEGMRDERLGMRDKISDSHPSSLILHLIGRFVRSSALPSPNSEPRRSRSGRACARRLMRSCWRS